MLLPKNKNKLQKNLLNALIANKPSVRVYEDELKYYDYLTYNQYFCFCIPKKENFIDVSKIDRINFLPFLNAHNESIECFPTYNQKISKNDSKDVLLEFKIVDDNKEILIYFNKKFVDLLQTGEKTRYFYYKRCLFVYSSLDDELNGFIMEVVNVK